MRASTIKQHCPWKHHPYDHPWKTPLLLQPPTSHRSISVQHHRALYEFSLWLLQLSQPTSTQPQSDRNDKISIAWEWRLASLQRGARQYQMLALKSGTQVLGLSVNFCHPAQTHYVSSRVCGDCRHHTCGGTSILRDARPLLGRRFADHAQAS